MRTSRTTQPSRRLVAAVAAMSLLALAACSGTDPVADTEDPAEATEQPDTEQPATDETDTDGTDQATDNAVLARNINFEPADITVEAGTEVSFTNEDIVRHTVTAGTPDEPGDDFDLSLDDQGDVVTFTFDEPGTYEYFCRLHPAMTGTVTVEG